jgi:hypothetical protein
MTSASGRSDYGTLHASGRVAAIPRHRRVCLRPDHGGRVVNAYQGRHRKHAAPDELPAILRGLANLIEVLDNSSDKE